MSLEDSYHEGQATGRTSLFEDRERESLASVVKFLAGVEGELHGELLTDLGPRGLVARPEDEGDCLDQVFDRGLLVG